MKIVISADYKSKDFKNSIKLYLIENGYEVIDKSQGKDLDFYESSKLLAESILNHEVDKGIVIDEYGTGSFNVCTKHKGIVCAQVADEHSAKMTRDHNNTSIIAIGSKVTSLEIARKIVDGFILSNYSGGRHQIRIDMLNKMA
ncbi:galactose-6-phosphate isomerase subunit LacA [Clostridium tertium]|jgi:galactose-6-phosphate isomerase|uniref:galactose-6-phosphate isomerase subunit LacA n=1 Tax=Clostridium TaxID=1485 RepID=UPI0018A96640|nr:MULTISPECIES: galactose-6-phosphate isomerase subunit LacA [Clostridium]MBS5307107.1 galactose-6-phosphate isomerase subunit LacA [Clostridium sp.]MDB1924422.1 galactose-6-phosphate isomerase subunit LacA [Clostridium tertium]MDB1927848.1 galactose-6-phosphate isomerase subunit LacA [Clostridium tertium]MDB1931472.1 galactose-6-phosphate isomerase subunit LacA [Clostridium tertium]MDB1934268.1 galactose-6-phosphate isomerase subunit LacA [Clostridium tertium]